MTNKEWLATLPTEEMYNTLRLIRHDKGRGSIDTARWMVEWLDKEHEEEEKTMIQFMGADMKMADDGSRVYIPRGPIFIKAKKIVGFYDHTVLVGDHKIRVMEDLELIRRKVRDNELIR